MAQGARIGSVVMFVRDLQTSADFYQDVLALEVADTSPTAVLLHNRDGTQLLLRAMGSGAAHALGSVGVQYIVWTAAGWEDLDRCERVLRQRAAHRETRRSGKVALVEGRDPDDLVLMIGYPGPDQVPLHEIPVRIYGW
jgi:catechol 2,3-dioxygenase-like lactoylglutathione lyase family enzyme